VAPRSIGKRGAQGRIWGAGDVGLGCMVMMRGCIIGKYGGVQGVVSGAIGRGPTCVR
jgi:hypothetical protein